MVIGATRRRKVVFSTDEKPHGSQEKKSSGTRSGTVAILVIREERPRTQIAFSKNQQCSSHGIREHEETLMGLATLCIHVFKASQAMKGSFSRPKFDLRKEKRGWPSS